MALGSFQIHAAQSVIINNTDKDLFCSNNMDKLAILWQESSNTLC